MASTNFKLFDENKANMMSDTEYNINTQRLNGVQAGIASSQLQNKTLYQTSLVAYSLAQIMMQNGFDAKDSASVSAFVGNMSNSLLQKVLDKATSVEAQNGINNTKWMTPALTKAAIDILAAKSANILSNETKTLYGLGSNAVPNDVFSYLGKYAEHWWKRYAVTPATYTLTPPPDTSSNYWLFIYRNNSIEWSTNVSVSSDGVVSLVNPTTTTADSIRTNTTSWRGRFVKGTFKIGSTSASNQDLVVHFTSQLSSASLNNQYVTINATTYETVKGVQETVSDVFDYVRSVNRNAYPDNGIQGGYKYQYIGVPFDNAVTAPKIATGSYTGTGTYGASHPNSLTFEFEPKLVIVSTESSLYPYHSAGSWAWSFIYSYGSITTHVMSSMVYFALEDKTLKWYSENVNAQLNESGIVYFFVAIG